jgi:hypothetical protein
VLVRGVNVVPPASTSVVSSNIYRTSRLWDAPLVSRRRPLGIPISAHHTPTQAHTGGPSASHGDNPSSVPASQEPCHHRPRSSQPPGQGGGRPLVGRHQSARYRQRSDAVWPPHRRRHAQPARPDADGIRKPPRRTSLRDPNGNAIPGRRPDRGADQLVRPRRPPQRTNRNHHPRRPRIRSTHFQA